MPLKTIESLVQTLYSEKSPYCANISSLNDIKEPLLNGRSGVFLDCGGYDGCSAIKFISVNPNFKSITFEPNPEMWPYYDIIPTKLIKKGVSHVDGVMPFTIDHIDGDGSSFVPTKKVLFGTNQDNSSCQTIQIECLGIKDIVERALVKYDEVILKLDVEGAEYDILETLHSHNLLGRLKKIYAEFHWKKCGFSKSRHNNLSKVLRKHAPVFPWDGADFAIHARGNELRSRRQSLVNGLDLKGYQTFDF